MACRFTGSAVPNSRGEGMKEPVGEKRKKRISMVRVKRNGIFTGLPRDEIRHVAADSWSSALGVRRIYGGHSVRRKLWGSWIAAAEADTSQTKPLHMRLPGSRYNHDQCLSAFLDSHISVPGSLERSTPSRIESTKDIVLGWIAHR
jgi:hypothetical protein